MNIKLLLVGLVLAADGHASDSQMYCFKKDRADANNAIFKIQLDSFAGAKADLCWKNDASEFSDLVKLNWAIGFIRDLRFKTDTYSSNLIPGILSTDYYSYIRQNIARMVRNNDAKSANDSGEIVAALDDDGTAELYDAFFSDENDTEDQASTLIHEARHRSFADPGKISLSAAEAGYAHVDCKRGTEKGYIGSCDPDFLTYRGAYAVELEFNARIYLFGANVEPMFVRSAREEALYTLRTKFNSLGPVFRANSRRRARPKDEAGVRP